MKSFDKLGMTLVVVAGVTQTFMYNPGSLTEWALEPRS
jgi:hypothetical protein